MQTATEMSKQQDGERRKRAFEYQMESFLNQWKPGDRREASEFEAQLISLVRQIYTDAQAPILEQFTRLAMAASSPLIIPGNPPVK